MPEAQFPRRTLLGSPVNKERSYPYREGRIFRFGTKMGSHPCFLPLQLSGTRYGSLKRSNPRGVARAKAVALMKRMLFVVAVAALDVRMGRVGAQRRAAGVPSEVVQLITGVGHVIPSWSES